LILMLDMSSKLICQTYKWNPEKANRRRDGAMFGRHRIYLR
jgi:hypothetical protein